MKRCPVELVKLMRLLYNLTPTEAEIFSFMCGNKLTVKKLASLTMKERSVVQKILKKLNELGLIRRFKQEKCYYYSLEDTEKVKKILKKKLKGEVNKMEKTINLL